jgi:hypothetical protein
MTKLRYDRILPRTLQIDSFHVTMTPTLVDWKRYETSWLFTEWALFRIRASLEQGNDSRLGNKMIPQIIKSH